MGKALYKLVAVDEEIRQLKEHRAVMADHVSGLESTAEQHNRRISDLSELLRGVVKDIEELRRCIQQGQGERSESRYVMTTDDSAMFPFAIRRETTGEIVNTYETQEEAHDAVVILNEEWRKWIAE